MLGGKGYVHPSDKLLIAGFGVGGKGRSDLKNFFESGKAEIAYLCDVDDRRSAESVKNFPKAKYYKDWREMFDRESKNFDAVSVSTPDHNHAVIASSRLLHACSRLTVRFDTSQHKFSNLFFGWNYFTRVLGEINNDCVLEQKFGISQRNSQLANVKNPLK